MKELKIEGRKDTHSVWYYNSANRLSFTGKSISPIEVALHQIGHNFEIGRRQNV